jgi:hypothetical protein
MKSFGVDAEWIPNETVAKPPPPSPPCPVASLARGIVIRVPSKSFSAARKNLRLQNLSHRACAPHPPS